MVPPLFAELLNATSSSPDDYLVYSEVAYATNVVPDVPMEAGLRVLGGDNANPGEFPHQAYVTYSEKGKKYMCSASIIHPLILLTAAHCAYNLNLEPPTFSVVTAEHYTSVLEGREQWLSVRTAIVHEACIDATLTNDIALLILQSPIKLDNFTQVIKIPEPNQSLPAWAYVSGWGSLGNKSKPVVLQKARVAYRDAESCRLAFGRKNLTVTDEIICAGDGDTNACKGDSGGPLTCEDSTLGEKFLCGIISWGDEKCKHRIKYGKHTPSVYVDVRKFHGWIQRHVQHWSEFHSGHFLQQLAPSSKTCKSDTYQSFNAEIRSWWEYLWG